MSFVQQYQLAVDATFIQRVTVALVKAAIAKMTGTPAQGVIDYSLRIFASPQTEGALMAQGVVTNPTIGTNLANSTDSDIEFAVNSMFDAYAGIGS